MDSLGNPLEIGKYYRIGHQPRAQYVGKSNDGSRFDFEYRNWANKNLKRTIMKTLADLQDPANIPVLLNNEESFDESDYNTDNEYKEDPIDNHNPSNYNNNNNDYDSDGEELVLDEVGGRRRRKKTRRHRKKTRKQRRKTRKHRKKSRKHRKR